jgi:YD repeat-containing protein
MKATFTDNEGNKTIYYFDSQYRVSKEEDALGFTVEYEYDDKDNITCARTSAATFGATPMMSAATCSRRAIRGYVVAV